MDAKHRLPSKHREQVYINCGWIIPLKGKIISLSGCKQISLPSVSIIGLAASDQLKIYLTNISTSVSVLTHIEIKPKRVGWTFLKLARGNPYQNKPVLGHDCQFPYLFYLQLGVYEITINADLLSPALWETDHRTFQTTIYSILFDNMILFSQIFTVAAVGYRSIVTICSIFFLTK